MTVAAMRRALAPVLAVDVLQHLFAPLVLEVDVDVGRLVALARDEALEQQRRAALWIHRGDAQAVAHARVGRRAAPLAQDPLRARKGHYIVHGEEIRLVAQFCDQLEFVLDGVPLGRRDALRPAPAGACFRELAQMTARGFPGRHQLVRILVAQLIEAEVAVCGHCGARLQQRARIQAHEACALAQVALAVGVQLAPERGDRRVETDGGEGILQAPAGAHVHVHIAAGDERHAAACAELREAREALAVRALAQQLDRDAQSPGKARRQPLQLLGLRLCRRQPQQVALLEIQLLEIGARECVAALRGSAPATRDETTQPAVAAPVDGEGDELESAAQAELRADDELQRPCLGRHVRPHHPCHRALIGDGKGLVAERLGLLHQFVRVRGAAQKCEIRQAVQFCVRGQHA